MRWLAGRPGLPARSFTPALPPHAEADNAQVTVETVARKGLGRTKKSSSRTQKRDSNSKGKQATERNRPSVKGPSQQPSTSSSSAKSDPSQRVDLVFEDTVAEEREREMARREGSATWNQAEHRHFVFVTTVRIL